MNNIIITRPKEDSLGLLEILEREGFDVISEPQLEINFFEINPDFLKQSFQAILITSANGIRALARITNIRDYKVVTVGVASKKEADNLGFTNVVSANGEKGGDVDILFDYICTNCSKNGGKLLHLAGVSISKNLKDMLCNAGYEALRINLYEAKKIEQINDDTAAKITAEEIDAVVFYSARSAESFIAAIKNNGLNQSVKSMKSICFSHRVADSLPTDLFEKILVTKEMDSNSLVSLLKSI